jgi:hypothetical protein
MLGGVAMKRWVVLVGLVFSTGCADFDEWLVGDSMPRDWRISPDVAYPRAQGQPSQELGVSFQTREPDLAWSPR